MSHTTITSPRVRTRRARLRRAGTPRAAALTQPRVLPARGFRAPGFRALGFRALGPRALGFLRGDAGMTTAEYAIGTLAAAAFAAVLYSVVTGDSIVSGLTELVERALSVGF